MNATTATAVNPILAALSDEEIIAAAASRHLKIIPAKAKVEKVAPAPKTDEELLAEALGLIVKVEVVWVDGTEGTEGHHEGKLVVIPASERTEGDAKVAFDALSLKARTTLEKIAASKRPAYTGAKRGPKAKTEGTDAPTTSDAPKVDEAPASDAPAA